MTTVGLDVVGASHAFEEDTTKRYVPPWRNPWRRPWVLSSITWLYILWSLVPVLIAIQFSFNNSRSRSSWAGFTTDWYCCENPGSIAEDASVISDPAMLLSLRNSVILAVATTLIAVPIGTALALGLTRWRSRTSWASPAITTAVPVC